MKIGYVTPEFVTENVKGGQATYLENVSKIFSAHGHEVVIIVLSDHNEEFAWKDKITVCRVKYQEAMGLDQISKYNFIKKIYYSFWAYAGISLVLNRKTKELYKEGKIEIVQYSSLRAIPLFMSKKIPGVIRLSAHPVYCRYAQEEKFDIEEAEKHLSFSEKIWMCSLKKADYIFGPSKIVGERVERKIGKKVAIIESPLRVNIDQMNPEEYNKYLKGKEYLLFFGTLNYLKGIQVIAPILDEFLDKYTETYFVFLGKDDAISFDGRKISAREYILKYAERNRGRILFIDSVYEKDKLNYIIHKSVACVLPSRVDNLPNTCIEAMALGKIVIGTNGASFEQLINDGENGYLCERDDPESLLKCMDKVMDMTEEEKNVMGMNAKLRTKEMSDEKIYNQLFNVYRNVIKQYR